MRDPDDGATRTIAGGLGELRRSLAGRGVRALVRPGSDPGSGYRYYRAEQACEALSIGLLRSLDVPLPAIGQVLAGRDVVAVLGAVKDRLEADLVRRRRLLATLNRVVTQGLPRAEVWLTRQDTRRVAVAAQLLGDRVPALEGRWWVEDDRPLLTVPRAQWRWHLFVRLPESVEAAEGREVP